MNRKCYTIKKETGELEVFTFSRLLSKTPGGLADYVLVKPEINPKWWVILPINDVYFEVDYDQSKKQRSL